MKCPECAGPLVMHALGEKAGMGHCNACGICWDAKDVKPKRTKKVTSGADD